MDQLPANALRLLSLPHPVIPSLYRWRSHRWQNVILSKRSDVEGSSRDQTRFHTALASLEKERRFPFLPSVIPSLPKNQLPLITTEAL
jgi:hypothetical protein